MRYARSPAVFSDSSLSPSFLRTTAARKPRTECGCQPVECMIVAMVAPLGRLRSPSTRACFEFARVRRWTTIRLRPAFARTLDEDLTLPVRAPLRLDMQNSSQGVGAPARRRDGALARRPPPKPRGGPSALAGERGEPSRLGVPDHTHRPLARDVP